MSGIKKIWLSIMTVTICLLVFPLSTLADTIDDVCSAIDGTWTSTSGSIPHSARQNVVWGQESGDRRQETGGRRKL